MIPQTLDEIILLFIAAVLGSTIGIEREFAGKDPSIRTFTMICIGSCLFTLLSSINPHESNRMTAQIISGVGFLGAGAIFRNEHKATGFTTAALMWITAAIGMSVGVGRMDLAIAGTVMSIFMSTSLRFVHTLLKPIIPKKEINHGRRKNK